MKRLLISLVAVGMVAGVLGIDDFIGIGARNRGVSDVTRGGIPMTKAGVPASAVTVTVIHNTPYEDITALAFDLSLRELLSAPLSHFSARQNCALHNLIVRWDVETLKLARGDFHTHKDGNIVGWQPSDVVNGDMSHAIIATLKAIDASRFHAQIGSQFELGRVSGYSYGALGSFGSLFGLVDSIDGRVSSSSCMKESSPDKEDTNQGQQRSSGSDYEHPLRPTRHALLGIKIALSAFLFFGGLGLIYVAFNRAGEAIEAVLDGTKRAWSWVIFWLGVSLGSALLASGVITYWLSICGKC